MWSVAAWAVAAAAAAAAALAQESPAAFPGTVSPRCSSTLVEVTAGTAYRCLRAGALLPLVTSREPIVPILDRWMSELCYLPPCTNDTLHNISQTLADGCGAELAGWNVNNDTVRAIVELYPLARDVICLKTSEYYNSTGTGSPEAPGRWTPPNGHRTSIPITSPPYNLTDGAFCVTSLLTELSDYLATNLTVPVIAEAVQASLNGDTTVLDKLAAIPDTALCQDCIFAAVDLVAEQYPDLVNATFALPPLPGCPVPPVVPSTSCSSTPSSLASSSSPSWLSSVSSVSSISSVSDVSSISADVSSISSVSSAPTPSTDPSVSIINRRNNTSKPPKVPGRCSSTTTTYSIASFLNSTCAASGFAVTYNGTLPGSITESAVSADSSTSVNPSSSANLSSSANPSSSTDSSSSISVS